MSTEEIKSDGHQRILEESLQTLLREWIDNAPYLAPAEGMFGPGGSSFAEIPAPVNLKALAGA